MIGLGQMRLRGGIGRLGVCGLALCAGLSAAGCADLARVTSLAPDGVDASSSVAQQVRAASAADYPRPRFRDIPPAPTDVRAPEAWRNAVNQTVQAGAAVTAWVEANPTTIAPNQTEVFAEGQRASIPAGERQAAPVDPAGTEAFAARLRAMAAPPPPPN